MKRRYFLATTAAAGAAFLVGGTGLVAGLPDDQQVIRDDWTWNPLDERWEKLDDWRELNFLRRTIQDPKPSEPHFVANLIGQPVGFQSRAWLNNSWFPFEYRSGHIELYTHPGFKVGIPSTDFGRPTSPEFWQQIMKDIEQLKPFGQVGLFIHGDYRVSGVAVPDPFNHEGYRE